MNEYIKSDLIRFNEGNMEYENSEIIENPHFNGIDVLRAFSCIAIVAWHVFANTSYSINPVLSDVIIPSWDNLVFLFMMISGFGICTGYYEKLVTGSISLETFFIKRYIKIVPFFSLLVLLDILLNRSFESVAEGLTEIFLIHGFLPNNQLSVIGVAWTLGVIFAFYIVFPFVVFLISNKTRMWLTFFLSVLIHFLCQVYFFSEEFVVKGFSPKTNLLYCMPFFLVGCIISIYRKRIIQLVSKRSLISFVICILLTMGYYLSPHRIGGVTIDKMQLLILYAFWVIFAIGGTYVQASNRIIQFISGISMEIYLSHMVCFRLVEKLGVINALPNGLGSYLIVLAVVVCMLLLFIPITQKALNFITNRTFSCRRNK